MDRLISLIEQLLAWNIRVTLISTVRSGQEGLRVWRDPQFRYCREHLDWYELDYFTHAEMAEVLYHFTGASVIDDTDPRKTFASPQFVSARELRVFERSFAFLREDEFGTLLREYTLNLSSQARTVLQAARLLAEHGIPLTEMRWLLVAERLFSVNFTAVERGVILDELQMRGFLSGSVPSADSVLFGTRREIAESIDESQLLRVLDDAGDAVALVIWGNNLVYWTDDETGASVVLQTAIRHFVQQGDVESLAQAADACISLALWDRDVNVCRGCLRDAIRYGRKAQVHGRDAVVIATSLLGKIAYESGGPRGRYLAVRLWRLAVESDIGLTSTRAKEAAALAATALGSAFHAHPMEMLIRAGERRGFSRLALRDRYYAAAVQWGKDAGTQGALMVAAHAASMLGHLLQQKSRESPSIRSVADQYCELAIETGTSSRAPFGIEEAAHAAFMLAWGLREDLVLATEKGDIKRRSQLLPKIYRYEREAIHLGEKSGTHVGIATAVIASYKLAFYSYDYYPDNAIRYYINAIRLGMRSPVPIAWAYAAKAASVLGDVAESGFGVGREMAAIELGIGMGPPDLFRLAIAMGHASSRWEGLNAALGAGISLASHLRRWGRLAEADAYDALASKLFFEYKSKYGLGILEPAFRQYSGGPSIAEFVQKIRKSGIAPAEMPQWAPPVAEQEREMQGLFALQPFTERGLHIGPTLSARQDDSWDKPTPFREFCP